MTQLASVITIYWKKGKKSEIIMDFSVGKHWVSCFMMESKKIVILTLNKIVQQQFCAQWI